MKTTQKILLFLALVAATPVVYTEQASLWGQNVFPNDLSWRLHHKVKKIEHEKNNNDLDTKNNKVCETKDCFQVSKEFLSSMNKSVDPCDDFYQFTCGGWTRDRIPPSSTSWSRFMIFQQTVEHRIKGVLETEPEPTDILPVRQAKKWYRSCMDTEGLENRGLKPIESILMQAGGWPIAMDEEEWDPEEHTWQRVDRYYAHLTGAYAFYDIDAFPSFDEDESGGIRISSSSIPLTGQLPTKYRNYTGNDYETYVHLVEAVVELFVEHNRANVSNERLRKEAEDIVEFEKKIYELQDTASGYEEMVFEDMMEWYETNITEGIEDPKTKVDWESVIQELFGTVNMHIDPDVGILITGVDYFKGINSLLKETPVRTIVNYVHWNIVSGLLKYTTETLRDAIFELVREEYGAKSRPPRWSECVNDMQMSHAAAYVFVNKYFTKDTETRALKMIKNIQSEMESQIENSNWLDEESKKIAKDKLNNMDIFVGFPEWYKNKTAVMNYYKGLSVGTDYFDNILSYIRYRNKKALRRFVTSESEEDPWHIDPITVNALYDPDANSLNIPAVDFQAPLFTSSLPDYVNYGIAGVIVGHEMGHGFDPEGIRYSKHGNETILSKSILKNYYQRAECFLDQFEEYYGETRPPPPSTTSEYDFLKIRNRASMTSGENVADTTGIQAVFQAFQKKNKIDGSLKLPGLEEFTDEQLFFISFAGTWCEIATPEYEKKERKSRDPHSPARLRVIGSVSNTKDFARVFNCPEDKAMNPKNKCSIWEKPGAVRKPAPVPQNKMKIKHRPWGGQWKY